MGADGITKLVEVPKPASYLRIPLRSATLLIMEPSGITAFRQLECRASKLCDTVGAHEKVGQTCLRPAHSFAKRNLAYNGTLRNHGVPPVGMSRQQAL